MRAPSAGHCVCPDRLVGGGWWVVAPTPPRSETNQKCNLTVLLQRQPGCIKTKMWSQKLVFINGGVSSTIGNLIILC